MAGAAAAGAPADLAAAAAAGGAPLLGAADGGDVNWTAANVCLSLALFAAAAAAEIGGGWLVWQALRERRGWWLAAAGAAVLFLYGVIPTFQPSSNFGRVYAVYGGFFVAASYLWGWAVDGVRPDAGDWVGTAVALAGVALAFWWPRGGGGGGGGGALAGDGSTSSRAGAEALL